MNSHLAITVKGLIWTFCTGASKNLATPLANILKKYVYTCILELASRAFDEN